VSRASNLLASERRSTAEEFMRGLSYSYFAQRKLRMTLPKTRLSIVLAFLWFLPASIRAQSPRDYLNTPVHAATIQLGFLKSNTETASASDLALPNNVAVSRLGVASLLWSFPLGDKYGGVEVTGGYTDVKSSGPFGQAETTGFSDPGLTFHANLFGAPALRKEQFAAAIPQTYMSVHFTMNPPLGSYDSDSGVNTGANRWAFIPLVNLDITRDKGVSWFDLYASGRFFTSNDAFQGNNQLSQNPLGKVSAFYSHNIGTRWWAGFGANYDNGGKTYINSISQRNAANGFQPSISLSRARTIWKFRVTLKYELTGTTPHAAPTNSVFVVRLAGPIF
jgi:hypothetical protein